METAITETTTGAPLRMSLEAIGWALRDAPGVPVQCVSVLFGLAEHADRNGRGAYVGQVTLAGYARKSDRSVRNDLALLLDLGIIRRGNQALAAHIAGDARPVVYDLAMERKPASGRKHSSGRKSATGRQSASDRDSQAPDQQEQTGSGSLLPGGSTVPAGSTAHLERKPASDKPSTNPKEPTPPELAARPAKPRTPSGNAGDVIAAYVEGAVAAGQQRPPEKLRARVGRDAKQLIGEGWPIESLIESARRMGGGEWNDLAVQVRKDAAGSNGHGGVAESTATQRARAGIEAGRRVQAMIDEGRFQA